jgi:hypothetical protein
VTCRDHEPRAHRQPGYEKIVGIAHFAVNPRAPGNAVIADVDKAPMNLDGKVEFSSDVYILRPLDAATSNGVALVDVLNRGRKIVLGGFNRGATNDPVTDADLGDGFLMRRGYTVVWVGWEFDIRRVSGRQGEAERGAGMAIQIPSARGVSDVIRASFTPNDDGPQTVGDLAGYRPTDDNARDTTLSVRDGEFGAKTVIARERFTMRGNQITLTGGFEKGRTYELIYRPTEWPVSGLGLAAYRDFATWIKHAPDAVAKAGETHRLRFAERPVPAQLPLRRLQHRRTGTAGARRRMCTSPARRAQHQRAWRPAHGASSILDHAVPVRHERRARSGIAAHRRPARQRPRAGHAAEGDVHEHRGGVLGRRTCRGAGSHDTRRQT